MTAPIVYIDIAGPDSAVLKEFYANLFSWNISGNGSFSIPIASLAQQTPTIMGTIRQDPAEKVLYIGVENISEKLAEVEENGGTIDQPRFEVPGVVILGLFRDSAGNRMGLVEMENGMAKIP